VALRHVANELEALEAALPDWHVAAIDDALGDSNEEAVSWDAALSQLRDEVAGA